MTVDEFTEALKRLVVDAQSKGLSTEQLVDALESLSDTLCSAED